MAKHGHNYYGIFSNDFPMIPLLTYPTDQEPLDEHSMDPTSMPRVPIRGLQKGSQGSHEHSTDPTDQWIRGMLEKHESINNH